MLKPPCSWAAFDEELEDSCDSDSTRPTPVPLAEEHVCWRLHTRTKIVNGDWVAVYGAQNACSDAVIWEGKLSIAGPLYNVNLPMHADEDPNNAGQALEVANSVARMIFEGLLGKKGVGESCVVEVERAE